MHHFSPFSWLIFGHHRLHMHLVAFFSRCESLSVNYPIPFRGRTLLQDLLQVCSRRLPPDNRLPTVPSTDTASSPAPLLAAVQGDRQLWRTRGHQGRGVAGGAGARSCRGSGALVRTYTSTREQLQRTYMLMLPHVDVALVYCCCRPQFLNLIETRSVGICLFVLAIVILNYVLPPIHKKMSLILY